MGTAKFLLCLLGMSNYEFSESFTDLLKFTIIAGKVKAHELRTKSKGELLTQLKELKEELSTVNHLMSLFSTWSMRKCCRYTSLLIRAEILTSCRLSCLISYALHKLLAAPLQSFLKLDPSESQSQEC
jgi:hypothetical protein